MSVCLAGWLAVLRIIGGWKFYFFYAIPRVWNISTQQTQTGGLFVLNKRSNSGRIVFLRQRKHIQCTGDPQLPCTSEILRYSIFKLSVMASQPASRNTPRHTEQISFFLLNLSIWPCGQTRTRTYERWRSSSSSSMVLVASFRKPAWRRLPSAS